MWFDIFGGSLPANIEKQDTVDKRKQAVRFCKVPSSVRPQLSYQLISQILNTDTLTCALEGTLLHVERKVH